MTETKPKPIVVANWKCNGVKQSIFQLVSSWKKCAFSHDVECYVGCPSLYIPFLRNILPQNFEVAAQNCVASTGAFTGEICVEQLVDCDVHTVIVGHSERRKLFSESERMIGEKCNACVHAGVRVVACIGERLCDRNEGRTREVVRDQLRTIIRSVPARLWKHVVIAYEPIWAIGTGKVALPADIQCIHAFIREILAAEVSSEVSRTVRILYGGSVTSKTARSIYEMPDVNGFLVGGASLSVDFIEIIKSTRN